eukprot:8528901-Pyramimonas_sp.AAC.1
MPRATAAGVTTSATRGRSFPARGRPILQRRSIRPRPTSSTTKGCGRRRSARAARGPYLRGGESHSEWT